MNKLIIFSLLVLLVSCSSNENEKISILGTDDLEMQMIEAYKEGYRELERGDVIYATRKFNEAELLYPQSEWASKSALMASYSYYMQNYYPEAISNLERYLKTYPTDKDIAYAYYLIAMCYYETIEDEKRDTASLINAKEKFDFVVTNYPSSDFALDAKFKLGLIRDILASKEMYLGRHYIKKGKWTAAIKRFQNIIDNYSQTIFTEEALHRLVEINYKLGLDQESKKYANILGYNYLSSDWYKKSYKVFNQDYSIKINKPIKKDKRGVINKFKKLFD